LLAGGARDQDVVLRDGDNIFIATAGLVYVTGQVKKPDSYPVDSDSTVLMTVTRAGGFTNIAAKGRIRVIRKVDGAEQILEKVPMNLAIQPGDVIVVPESFF
jgi:polysaccharide export outer membrane protein